MKGSFDFEKTLGRLTDIVDEFSRGESLTLDNAFKNYKDGVSKYVECLNHLDLIENEVVLLAERMEQNQSSSESLEL